MSDFSGFGESDIDVPYVHEQSSDDSSDEDEQVDPGASPVRLYACGTVRVNRLGYPKDLKKPREVRDRGDMKILQKGDSNLTATVWKDKRLVYHLSTLSNPTDIHDAQRRVHGQVLRLQQPHSVYAYNQFMGGVDLHDQFRAKYSVGRNGKKWWRYLFWFMLNCCIINANIMYQMVSRRVTKRKRFAHLNFRQELVHGLVGGFAKRKRSRGDAQNQGGAVGQENIVAHVSCYMESCRTTCKYHSCVLKERRETVYGCSVCKVHLCRDGCHARYHAL